MLQVRHAKGLPFLPTYCPWSGLLPWEKQHHSSRLHAAPHHPQQERKHCRWQGRQ